jgi:hypothetical protein
VMDEQVQLVRPAIAADSVAVDKQAPMQLTNQSLKQVSQAMDDGSGGLGRLKGATFLFSRTGVRLFVCEFLGRVRSCPPEKLLCIGLVKRFQSLQSSWLGS